MSLRRALGLKKKRLPPVASIVMDTPDDQLAQAGNKGRRNYTWHRGPQTNYFPSQAELRTADGALRHIVQGWAPAEPMITRSTVVTAFGSCFAEHISRWLHARDYSITSKRTDAKSYLISCSEGMVNTFAIRGQLEWALEGRVPAGEFWHGYDAKAFGYEEDVRADTEAILRSTDLFIITLGLSEVWCDVPTGEVFWRAVPADKFDPGRHRFRVTSTIENADNLRHIYQLIRTHVPKARIVLTLSPIPLAATFRPVSCVTASTVSKAILRAAIDEVVMESMSDGVLHYWPSYEIVKEYCLDPFKPDGRHVKQPILDYIMTLFESVWCQSPPPADLVTRRYRAALAADRGFLARLGLS